MTFSRLTKDSQTTNSQNMMTYKLFISKSPGLQLRIYHLQQYSYGIPGSQEDLENSDIKWNK